MPRIIDALRREFRSGRVDRGEDVGVGRTDHGFILTQTAGDYHPPIFQHGFLNGFERFTLGTIDKAAGIYHDHLGLRGRRSPRRARRAQSRS